MEKVQTRRGFIEYSTKIFGTLIGVITMGRFASFSHAINHSNSFLTGSSFENKSENKILVAYESQFGSTAEVAKFIGKNLSTKNRTVEVRRINEISDISPYSKVIIGSAIQYDTWMPETRQFLSMNKNALSKIPVAYFFTCLTLSIKNDKTELQANGYSNKIRALVPEVSPVSVGQFAGVLNYSKMPFGMRFIAKVALSIMGVKEGDYRNWDEIRLWTEKLAF